MTAYSRKLENSPETYSEINARKALYKRVCYKTYVLLTRSRNCCLKMVG